MQKIEEHVVKCAMTRTPLISTLKQTSDVDMTMTPPTAHIKRQSSPCDNLSAKESKHMH